MISAQTGKTGRKAHDFMWLAHTQGDVLEPSVRLALNDWVPQAHGKYCAHVFGSVDLDRSVSKWPPCPYPLGSIILHLQLDATVPEGGKPFRSTCLSYALDYTSC